MESKYAWIAEYAAKIAAERKPGEITFRRVARMGGHHDNLSAIQSYLPRTLRDGRIVWASHQEVVSLVPSYISTAPLACGSAHGLPVDIL